MSDDQAQLGWKDLLLGMGFQPTIWGGCRGRFENIETTVIEHPIKGLMFTFTHVTPRTMAQFHSYCARTADLQTLAQVMVDAYETIHPERRSAVATAPDRTQGPNRIFTEEAYLKARERLRQKFSLADAQPETGRPDGPSVPRAADEHRVWLHSPEGLWSQIKEAFFTVDEYRLKAEAEAFALDDPDTLYADFPKGPAEKCLEQYRKANPGYDPKVPHDQYELAVGVLHMLVHPDYEP